MSGDDDERPLFHCQGYGNRRGRSITFGVGFVQKCHALEIFLTNLHHDRQQLVHVPILANGKERLSEEAVHGFIGIAQHHGVMGVGCHAPHPEKNE